MPETRCVRAPPLGKRPLVVVAVGLLRLSVPNENEAVNSRHTPEHATAALWDPRMRLGSDEHIGFEQPLRAEVKAVVPAADSGDSFAWIQVPLGSKGGPLDVVARPSSASPSWPPPVRERVELHAWRLEYSDVEKLEIRLELNEFEPWTPPKNVPICSSGCRDCDHVEEEASVER